MTPKQEAALRLALDCVSTLANARDWVGCTPNERWDEDEMYAELCNATICLKKSLSIIQEALAEQPAPPPECQTEAEKTAFAFGWWKALEQKRKADSALDRMADNARELGLDYEPAQQQEPVNKYCCHLCFNKSGQMFLDRMILCPECGNKRCPKATYHELPCTNSNEPGQTGSIYTSPQPSKPWVGLTDDDIQQVRENCGITHHAIKTIEDKLRDKNA